MNHATQMAVISNPLNQNSVTPDTKKMDSNLHSVDKLSALNKETTEIKQNNQEKADDYFNKDEATMKGTEERNKEFNGLVNVELSADLKRDLY